jgi:hypothetical protein
MNEERILPGHPGYIRLVSQAKIDEVRLAYIAVNGKSISLNDDELDEKLAEFGDLSVPDLVKALGQDG